MLGSSAVWIPSTGSSPLPHLRCGTLVSPVSHAGDVVLYTGSETKGCIAGAFVSPSASHPLWIAEPGDTPSPGWVWRERLSDPQLPDLGEWIWARDMSCGCIPFRKSSGIWEVLLIRSAKKGEWGFPKGHREPGETEEENALRETLEETGTVVRILPGVRAAFRITTCPGAIKEIVLFPAMYESGPITLSAEHTEFAWLSVPEAMARIPFENDRKCLVSAAAHPEFHE